MRCAEINRTKPSTDKWTRFLVQRSESYGLLPSYGDFGALTSCDYSLFPYRFAFCSNHIFRSSGQWVGTYCNAHQTRCRQRGSFRRLANGDEWEADDGRHRRVDCEYKHHRATTVDVYKLVKKSGASTIVVNVPADSYYSSAGYGMWGQRFQARNDMRDVLLQRVRFRSRPPALPLYHNCSVAALSWWAPMSSSSTSGLRGSLPHFASRRVL